MKIFGIEISSAIGIWTSFTGTFASATTFTFTGTDKDVNLIQYSLFTCTDSSGSTRKIGYVKSASNAAGTITVTVVTNLNLAASDKDFKMAYNRKVWDYLHQISVPGEVIADASYSQGVWAQDIMAASYLLPVDASVLTAATGSGACAFNVYKGTTAMFAIAPDLATNTYLRAQRPSTSLGSSDTQFDITEIEASVTYRYTFDGTGTDPLITATNPTAGDTVICAAQNFAAGNNGTFLVTGSDTNYFEVANASGAAESNKTVGTGTITYNGLAPSGIAAGDNVSLRITSSAGTVKASDFQIKLFIIPILIFNAF